MEGGNEFSLCVLCVLCGLKPFQHSHSTGLTRDKFSISSFKEEIWGLLLNG